MKRFNVDQLTKCVEIAFILEPILDKKDCTTRFVDLEYKTLTDFLISAVNVNKIFSKYIQSVNSGNQEIYSHLIPAIKNSNKYKSDKNIVFGLLVFMFVTVKSRMISSSVAECLENIRDVIANSNKADVKNYLDGFKLNSTTSLGLLKKQIVKHDYETFYRFDSLFKLFTFAFNNVFKDPNTTSYQVCKEFIEGFPTVSKFVQEVDENKGLLGSLTNSFNKFHTKNSELSVGFLSDLTAAALFIYLSYQDPDTYVIK